MNLIPCSESCRYQQEGYCQLPPESKNISNVGEQKVKCLYYSPLTAKNPNSLHNL